MIKINNVINKIIIILLLWYLLLLYLKNIDIEKLYILLYYTGLYIIQD